MAVSSSIASEVSTILHSLGHGPSQPRVGEKQERHRKAKEVLQFNTPGEPITVRWYGWRWIRLNPVPGIKFPNFRRDTHEAVLCSCQVGQSIELCQAVDSYKRICVSGYSGPRTSPFLLYFAGTSFRPLYTCPVPSKTDVRLTGFGRVSGF